MNLYLIDNAEYYEPSFNGSKPRPLQIDTLNWVEQLVRDSNIDILSCDRALLANLFVLTAEKRPLGSRPSDKGIMAALHVIEQKARENKRNALKDKLAFRESNDLLKEYAACLVEKKAQPGAEAKIGHFIWQVKRKLFGLQVKNPMMLTLTGPQEGGKSFTIENQLCSPLKDQVYKADFTIFDDKFSNPVYENYLVLFFDELSKIKTADGEKLKHIISTKSVHGRSIFSERLNERPQNTTLIGTSNDSLGIQLTDTTGNRRFCEIQTLTASEMKRNYRVLESLDYEKLWQGVNEKAASPIVAYLPKLETEQADLTPTHHVEDFANDCLSHSKGFMLIEEIQKLYLQWCNDHGIIAKVARHVLSQRLQKLGYDPDTQKNKRGLYASHR